MIKDIEVKRVRINILEQEVETNEDHYKEKLRKMDEKLTIVNLELIDRDLVMDKLRVTNDELQVSCFCYLHRNVLSEHYQIQRC